MDTTTTLYPPLALDSQVDEDREPEFVRIVDDLRRSFRAEFCLWDGRNGELLRGANQQPLGEEAYLAELIRGVWEKRSAEIIADEGGLLLLALPAPTFSEPACVATAAFTICNVDGKDDLSGPARVLGSSQAEAAKWINQQENWDAKALLVLGEAVSGKLVAQAKVRQLQGEVNSVSDNLASTYEEISLIYGLTKHLRISSSNEELGEQAINWLMECVSAQGVAILYLPTNEDDSSSAESQSQPALIQKGEIPIDIGQFLGLMGSLELTAACSPLVLNRNITGKDDWKFAGIRQMIAAPLFESDNLHGWLVAFNHAKNEEFGSVEAGLLGSVGTLLGIHSGNRGLYRQQADFLSNVVRAMTSAIDAKDPYTCGHSDRVGRISVELGKHLGCDGEMLNTLYMAGLLHDIGKIGIDDNVLRKTGKLTEAEYEHIKLHPTLGYQILKDLKPLAQVLPAVLHHHEQWNGSGYPYGLAGENIPYIARILAVADSYDAMTSDRPYRKGMPLEKMETIFQSGKNKQWDPKVIDAYFNSKEEIRLVVAKERANLAIDVQKWS